MLTLVNPWVWQRLQAASFKNLLKFVHQRIVNQSVRAERLAAIELKWGAIEAADFASRLFNDQRARRRIPRIQIEFPEAIEPPAGHAAQIERRRSRAPYTVGAQRDLVIEIDVGILVPLVAGEAGGHQAFLQLRYLRHANRLAIQLRASPLLRRKK